MKFLLNLQSKKMPGIKTIKRLPDTEKIQLSSYGMMILVKYFIDDGKGPKMIGISTKNASFSSTVLLIIYDLKLRPALFIELKKDLEEDQILNFIGEFISKSKFKVPKGRVIEQYQELQKNLLLNEAGVDVVMGITMAALSGILTIVSVVMMLQAISVKAKHAAEERYVNTKIEQELNEELFEGQRKNETGFEMFAKIEQYLDFILNKKANALILGGPPGMSKTYMVRRTLHFNKKIPGKDYIIEKGSALGLASTYALLYQNRNKLLILDDFDTPLKDPEIVNLLKAITDTYGKRVVSLASEKIVGQASIEAVSAAPRKFEFKGQVIIITNLELKDLDLALRSRAPAIEVNYNTKQIMGSTEKLLKFMSPKVPMKFKEEVFKFITRLYRIDNKINVNFRSIKSSIDARVGNPGGWKDMIKIIVDYKGGSIKETFNKKYIRRLKEGVNQMRRK